MTIVIDEVGLKRSPDEPTNIMTCSWCGEVIETERKQSAGWMCQSCYAKMLVDFQKAQQQLTPTHASDR